MASFKETRNLVLESYVDGAIDEDDLMLLYDINQSKNPEFPHENHELGATTEFRATQGQRMQIG